MDPREAFNPRSEHWGCMVIPVAEVRRDIGGIMKINEKQMAANRRIHAMESVMFDAVSPLLDDAEYSEFLCALANMQAKWARRMVEDENSEEAGE
jgi:hypothetical protein